MKKTTHDLYEPADKQRYKKKFLVHQQQIAEAEEDIVRFKENKDEELLWDCDKPRYG